MIGHPTGQVRTPGLFNPWAARRELDVVMVPLDLPPAGVRPFFEMLRLAGNCLGAVVTVPHKQAAFACLGNAEPAASFLQACNVVRRESDGSLTGAMTDGLGYAAALALHGVDPKGADFLLIGAGGAGSAIGHEMARKEVARLVILDSDGQRRDRLSSRLATAFPTVPCLTDIPDDFAFDIACNATPVGMAGDARLPFPLDALPDTAVVTDVVTDPALTPWLEAAKARRMKIQTGSDMVGGQFELIVAHLFGDLG
jgi:shikimate dehydrogenase